ncbi:OmpA family protein [Flavihumibacter sp. RY-1]|uniref:OmpA family protein n=1 Tax=Flavihumibacter fluminis TaxID=2909236 RepID=A0ABS9BDV5_9BACT|nr:OmpA family protein [Flavihumibacter fluminis]MCF1713686.1 OmpA family protein [Flavihumibacter fluminis]
MKALPIMFLGSFFILSTSSAGAQITNPKKVLERKVTNKANQAINKEADKAVDSAFKAKKNPNEPKKETTPANDTTVLPAGGSEPSLQSYTKFDFVPGEKVLFYDDFSQEAIGDFPAAWNTNGTGEVVTTNLYPGKWMKFAMRECIWTDELLKLPDNYTIEFDIVPLGGLEGPGMSGWQMRLMQAKNAKAWDGGSAPGNGGFKFEVAYYGRPGYSTWFYGDECAAAKLSGYVGDEILKEKINQKYHISIWVQKSRIRIYQDQNKIIDLPKAFPTGCVKPDRLRFEYGSAMISNVRIAIGAPDMRSKLITEGKLVTYGIYFDVNKDVIKPESYGTLKGIADVLAENPDVKIKIIGHTDADGNDANNLDLSIRRAAAVKSELVKTFGIDAARIDSEGKGEIQPVAPNDTPSNKALNRRVEFVKQ